MRGRLIAVLITLLVAVLVSLGVPLARSVSAEQARGLYLDRLADLARFAELVPTTAVAVDRAELTAELRRYDELYGVAVAVVGAGGTSTALTSRPDALNDPGVRPAVPVALAGRVSDVPGQLMPWDRAPLVVAQPVTRNGDVVAAVVSVSDTGTARRRVATVWALLTAAAVVALALGSVLAVRLAGWMLRPVAELDAVAHRIAAGDLTARVPSGGGPPEVRRLGAAFNDMAANVQASLESQRRFVADASHQLRNPLGALLVRLQGLALAGDPRTRAAAEAAVDDGQHLAGLLDRMLELARAEHVGTTPAVLDVGAVVDERLASWRVIAEHRSIRIARTGAAAGDAPAWGNPAGLSGALDAVLDNALKYAPQDSLITVDVAPVADGTAVTVLDQGPGLGEQEFGRVGARFWRGRAGANVSGTGLGLSIAATLLQRDGGSLQITPGDGVGLRVRLLLPEATAQGLPER